MKLHTLRTFALAISCFLIVLLASYFGVAAHTASAQWSQPVYSSYNGFSVWRAEYAGPSTTCSPTQIEFEYRLRDSTTLGPLTNHSNLQTRFIHGIGENYTFTPWQYVNSSTLLRVCVEQDHYLGFDVWANGGSVYQGGREWTIRASTTATRVAEVGDRYYKDIYLTPRANPTRTATPISPIRTSVNAGPSATLQLNTLPSIHGATGVRKYTVSFENFDTGEEVMVEDDEVRGGVGQYTLGTTELSDGFIRWISMLQMNGTTTMSSGPTSRYTTLPKTNFSRDWIPFILDRTAPLTTLATSITPINSNQDNVTLTASIFDYDSGPSVTTLVIENLDTGAVTEIDRTFPLHADGFYSADWGDNIDVTATVTLDHFTNYRMFARTTDVAGNITISNERFIAYGNSGSDSSSVLVQNPRVTLAAAPTSLTEGDTTTLTWTTRRTTNCTASGGTWSGSKNATGGSETVTVLASATYQLVCTNASGSDTATVDVTATPPIPTVPPTITLNVANPIIRRNESTTLTWSIDPATDVSGCTVTGATDSPTPVGAAGTLSTNVITSQRTITLSCSHPTGTVSESVTIQVIPQLFEQ